MPDIISKIEKSNLMASGIIGDIDVPAGIPTGSADLIRVLKVGFTSAFALAGVVSLLFLIYGGYRYIMSAGDANKVQEAQDTLTNALIGLFIVLASGLILNFIANRLGVGNLILVLNLPV